MTKDEIRATLQRTFVEVFEDDDLTCSDALDREALAAWDSLGHIRLISAVEDAFAIQFTIDEIEGLKTFGRFVDLIATKV